MDKKTRVICYEKSRNQHYFREFPQGTDKEEVMGAVSEGRAKYGQAWIEEWDGVGWQKEASIK